MPIASSAPAAADSAASGGILPAPPPAASGSGGAPAGNFDQVLSGTQAGSAPGAADLSANGSASTPAAADAASSSPDAAPAGRFAFHGRIRTGHPPLSSDSSGHSASRGKDSKKAAPADASGLPDAPALAPALPLPEPAPDPASALAGAAVVSDPPPAGAPTDLPDDAGAADNKAPGPPNLAAATADPGALAAAAVQSGPAAPAGAALFSAAPARSGKGREGRAEAKAGAALRPPASAAAGSGSPPSPPSIAPARMQVSAAPAAPSGAKIAPAQSDSPVLPSGDQTGSEKHSLDHGMQRDENTSSPLGIGAAQDGSTMPAAPSDTAVLVRAFSPEPSGAPAASAAPASAASAPTPGASASAPVRATVETVVRLVEAQASRGLQTVSAVNLNFQVGAEELAVRVEWRNGEVHTQFRTDSEDLRSALASQWQSVSPGLADRSVHFAPPVFGSATSAGGQGFASAGGESAPRQQGQPQQAGQGGAGRFTSSAAARPAASASTTPAHAGPAPRAGRLQTFA